MSESEATSTQVIEYLPKEAGSRSLIAASQPEQTINPARVYLAKLPSKNSRRTMASYLNSAARWLEGNQAATWQTGDWSRLSRLALLAYEAYLRDDKKLALRSIKTALAALRGVAREAWFADLITQKEYQQIKAESHRVTGYQIAKGRSLSRAELTALLETCKARHNIRGLRDRAIIAVLALCGVRREELVMLDYGHINWQDETLRVMGKGNKERIALLPDDVIPLLQDWCERVRGRHAGPLFFQITRGEATTEQRLSVDGLHYIVTKLASEAGIERCTAHDLRRTFATLQFESNVDILTVRDNMGHASVTTTQIYDHRGMEARRKSLEALKL